VGIGSAGDTRGEQEGGTRETWTTSAANAAANDRHSQTGQRDAGNTNRRHDRQCHGRRQGAVSVPQLRSTLERWAKLTATTAQSPRCSLKRSNDIRRDPTAVEAAGLRLHFVPVDKTLVDAGGIEGQVIAQGRVWRRGFAVAPGCVFRKAPAGANVPVYAATLEFAETARVLCAIMTPPNFTSIFFAHGSRRGGRG
jgi:hypothetical protein